MGVLHLELEQFYIRSTEKPLIHYLDRCTLILGVYLLGNYVLPIFVLGPRSCPWPDPHSRNCLVGTIHVSRSLV